MSMCLALCFGFTADLNLTSCGTVCDHVSCFWRFCFAREGCEWVSFEPRGSRFASVVSRVDGQSLPVLTKGEFLSRSILNFSPCVQVPNSVVHICSVFGGEQRVAKLLERHSAIIVGVEVLHRQELLQKQSGSSCGFPSAMK